MRYERGSALLNAIVVAGIIATIAGVIMTQTQVTDKASRAPRIRSSMAIIESRMQLIAQQPNSYTCNSAAVNDISSCIVNAAAFTGLGIPSYKGAVCPAGSPTCGIRVDVQTALTGLTFSGTITYEGTETPIRPITITINIAPEALASAINEDVCPVTTPIFKGYTTSGPNTGKPLCDPLPTTCMDGKTLTSQGTYISGVDKASMTPICSTFGTTITGGPCGANSYLAKFQLTATGTSGTCSGARSDPFSVFSYVPTSPVTKPTILVTAVLPAQCPAKPADVGPQDNGCPPGDTGSDMQTHTWTANPWPTCWTAAAWVDVTNTCAVPPPTTTLPAGSCVLVDYTACSANAPPGFATCYTATFAAGSIHGTNHEGNNLTMTIHLTLGGVPYTCNYGPIFLAVGGSSVTAAGSCGAIPPDLNPGSVDFVNTSATDGPGGNNILGPGPSSTAFGACTPW